RRADEGIDRRRARGEGPVRVGGLEGWRVGGLEGWRGFRTRTRSSYSYSHASPTLPFLADLSRILDHEYEYGERVRVREGFCPLLQHQPRHIRNPISGFEA